MRRARDGDPGDHDRKRAHDHGDAPVRTKTPTTTWQRSCATGRARSKNSWTRRRVEARAGKAPRQRTNHANHFQPRGADHEVRPWVRRSLSASLLDPSENAFEMHVESNSERFAMNRHYAIPSKAFETVDSSGLIVMDEETAAKSLLSIHLINHHYGAMKCHDGKAKADL